MLSTTTEYSDYCYQGMNMIFIQIALMTELKLTISLNQHRHFSVLLHQATSKISTPNQGPIRAPS